MKKTVIFLLAFAALASCCCRHSLDSNNLAGFVDSHFKAEPTTLSDVVDLYVDYSTCVATASNSAFFNATHPTIVNSDPNFYSIKGPAIRFETSDRNEVYKLLRSIREVNYADLETTGNRIVGQDHQAILITDGEYFSNSFVRDYLNYPYFAPAFRQWLTAGHDIYIYSEPYVESGRFSKFRYYIIFTDDDVPDNLNDKFYSNAPKAGNVLVLHLSAEAPKLASDEIVFNETIKPQSLAPGVYDMGVSLDEAHGFVKDSGDGFLLRGPKVQLRKEDGFLVTDIKPVVSLLNGPYRAYCDSLEVTGKSVLADVSALTPVDDLFQIDKKAFAESGELVLAFSDAFYHGTVVTDEGDIVLKVDFVVDGVEDNFTDNDEINRGFQWNSISAAQNHAMNTSFYQSVSLTLKDPQVNPARNRKTVSSIYLFFPR